MQLGVHPALGAADQATEIPLFARKLNAVGCVFRQVASIMTVTGTRRDTSLQDADVSVTVVDREMLNQARIRDVRQLDGVVPNVQFNESGQLGSTFTSIRGIESNPFIANRAAVYIDGIPLRDHAVLNQVGSIEVLRGP